MTYFFFIISLFIAILYYTFSPSDQIKSIEIPRSETIINSFLAQHRGAVDFVNERLNAPFIEIPRPVSSSDIRLLPCSIVEQFAVLQPETASELSGFLISECYDQDLTPASNGFASTLICLDAVNEETIVPCVDDTRNQRRKRRYVLTYGNERDWWREETQGSALWREALFRQSRASTDCGVLASKNGKYVIDNTNPNKKVTRPIPEQIFKTILETRKPSAPKDMLVCLTPVNEPYVSNGLIFAVDSYLNTMETQSMGGTSSNIHIKHESEPDKWASLATQTGSSPTPLDKLIAGTVINMQEPWAQIGTVFNSTNYSQFNAGASSVQLTPEDLGNSFTISYVIEYQSTTDANPQATFGWINTVNEGLKVGYENSAGSNIICFNITPTVVSNALCSSTPITKRVQITYILDYNKHMLYINNKLDQQQDLTKPFTGFSKDFPSSGNTDFFLGKISGLTDHGLTGKLYNFRVYNRALTEKEREYNYIMDKAKYNLQ